MKQFLILLLLVLQTFMLQAAEFNTGFNHSGWDMLLKKHVVSIRDGQTTQVNYAGMATDRASLKTYLDATSAISRTTFDRWPKQEQLAFLINAYNAWTVELILSGYPGIESIKDLGSLFSSPWSKAFIPLLGEMRTLDNIEHDLIRGSGRYQEPRIHFAVNCASIGCPALRPEAFVAERLDAQLEQSTRFFISDQTRNRLEGDTLRLSRIFKWYRGDFEKGWRGASSLGQFLSLYRQSLKLDPNTAERLKTDAIEIEFLDYDWRLNKI